MTTFRSDRPAVEPRPKQRIWLWLGIVALVPLSVLMLRVGVARSFDFGTPPPLARSGQLPIILPDGSQAKLRDLVKPGRPTLITFWASWCGPCIMEAPKIAELRRQFGPDRLNILSLNVRDEDASREMKAQFLVDAGLAPEAYAVLADENIRVLANSEDVLIPRTLVFDRSGAPLARITGYKPLALDRVAGLIAR